MNIKTEQDVTCEAAKKLREELKMNQVDFWAALGVAQSSGCFYENGRKMPKQVKRLLFSTYVANLPIDASTPEGAARLFKLAQHEQGERTASAGVAPDQSDAAGA